LKIIYPDVPDNYRTRLDLQWPIYTGGRYEALERAARADSQASSEDLAAARVHGDDAIAAALEVHRDQLDNVRVVVGHKDKRSGRSLVPICWIGLQHSSTNQYTSSPITHK